MPLATSLRQKDPMNNDLPTIETARLILRPPIQSDFVSWSALMADE